MIDLVMGLCTMVFLIRTYQLAKNENTRIPRKVSREYAIVVFIIAYTQLIGGFYLSSTMNALTSIFWLEVYLKRFDTQDLKKE